MVSPLPPTEDRSLTVEERAKVLDRTEELLELTYRARAHGGGSDVIDDLVHLVLTRNTSRGADHGTYRTLFKRWGSWDSVRLAPDSALTAVLKASGLPAQRVRHLRELLTQIHDDSLGRGGANTSLGWLRTVQPDVASDYLSSLPRVSVAEANRIGRLAFAQRDLATDPYTHRVLIRMGLRPESGSPGERADLDIPRSVDADALRTNLEHHSRSTCKTVDPNCGACPLISFCATGRTVNQGDGKPVALELFAGGGGLGEGFDRAGFDVALAVEIDRDAAQTYRVNHPGTVVVEADATRVTGDELRHLAPRLATTAALIAGPPCQGYSAAGRRQADDDRNNLYTAVVRLAADVQPRFVVIENVPGMRRVAGESYVSAVLDALRAVGYSADEHLLRACDYGVPQLRRRMIFLAQLKGHGQAPQAPAPTHCAVAHCRDCSAGNRVRCGRPTVPTVMETLKQLLVLTHGEVAEYVPVGGGKAPLSNASTMAHSQRVVEKISGITAGSGPISYRRLHADIARTIVAGHRALPVHPTLNRTISVREAARIQGFADGHVFAGPRSKQPLQVANAVPPAMGQAIAETLMRILDSGEKEPQHPVPTSETADEGTDADSFTSLGVAQREDDQRPRASGHWADQDAEADEFGPRTGRNAAVVTHNSQGRLRTRTA